MNRDYQIIQHIFRYCEEIDEAMSHFGLDYTGFQKNAVYRNAVSMPVQQVGELAKHLTDEFISSNSEIPWKQIKGMRDWFAHQYLMMDSEAIWNTVVYDIPGLKNFCEKWLDMHQDISL